MWLRAYTVAWLLAALLAGAVGCEDELPAFANPPPVDSGPDGGMGHDAAADEDAGAAER